MAEHFLKQFGFEVYLPRVRRYQVRYHRRVETLRPYFSGYCFTRIELQWHDVKECPGVIRLVRSWGHDEPVHVPDEVIDALRKRERDGAIDLPNEKRGRKNPESATGCTSCPARSSAIPGSAPRSRVSRSAFCC